MASEYYGRVVRALRATGMSSGQAMARAFAARDAIARGHEMNASPTIIAHSIVRPTSERAAVARATSTAGLSFGTTRTRGGRGLAVGTSCATVPVEAWMLGPGDWELPPLRQCSVPGPEGAAAGLAYGIERFNLGRRPVKITVKRRDQMNGYLDEATRGALTLDAVEKMYSGTARDGTPVVAKAHAVQVEQVKSGEYIGPATVYINLRFGPNRGVMTRTFGWHRPEDKQFTAYHDLFELGRDTPENQGRGIGESLTRNSIRALMALGVPRIYTGTAWAGRYVWASFGWTWFESEVAAKMLEDLVTYLEDDRRVGRYALRGHTNLGKFDYGSLREFKLDWRRKQIPALSWNLGSLHLYDRESGQDVHVGRIFLAGIAKPNDPEKFVEGEEGADNWLGHLVLRPGHLTYERARERLKL